LLLKFLTVISSLLRFRNPMFINNSDINEGIWV